MKKIFFLLVLIGFLVMPFSVFADREIPTITAYQSNTLIKTGDAKVFSVTFIASASTGYFVLCDTTAQPSTLTNTKAEGGEATSGNSKTLDFSDKPLEFSTGLYVIVSGGTLLVSYK